MPTELSRMYFQDASTEALLRWSGISTADVIVVASMAIHMKPTLLVLTANSMVKVKRFAKIRKRRGRGAGGVPPPRRPGPSPGAPAPPTPPPNPPQGGQALPGTRPPAPDQEPGTQRTRAHRW